MPILCVFGLIHNRIVHKTRCVVMRRTDGFIHYFYPLPRTFFLDPHMQLIIGLLAKQTICSDFIY